MSNDSLEFPYFLWKDQISASPVIPLFLNQVVDAREPLQIGLELLDSQCPRNEIRDNDPVKPVRRFQDFMLQVAGVNTWIVGKSADRVNGVQSILMALAPAIASGTAIIRGIGEFSVAGGLFETLVDTSQAEMVLAALHEVLEQGLADRSVQVLVVENWKSLRAVIDGSPAFGFLKEILSSPSVAVIAGREFDNSGDDLGKHFDQYLVMHGGDEIDGMKRIRGSLFELRNGRLYIYEDHQVAPVAAAVREYGNHEL